MKQKENLVERINLTYKEFVEKERDVLIYEHLRRYGSIRRFCYGKVLDFACGCGYGSYLIAGNPEVEKVVAADIDRKAIDFAKKEFSNPKVKFFKRDVKEIKGNYDTLVCLETMEHIKDRKQIVDLVKRCQIDNLIISFPDKKTTHYNRFHFHDFITQDIIDMFPEHIIYHSVRFVDSQSLLLVRLPKRAPAYIFRNIRDLH